MSPNLFIAVLRRDLDLWPSTFAAYRLWRDETLYQIWAQSNNPRRRYCDFSVWPYDLEHVLSVALGSGIIFTKFDLRQYPCLNCSVFNADMLCHAVTLTVDSLTLKVCGTSSFTWSVCMNFEPIKQSPAELLIILRIFAPVMSGCDLDLWPLDLVLLQPFGCHAFKLSAKFERNRLIHGWVIDDLARFRVQF